ncbi:MAG: hypothetical protein KBB99_03940, partial [Bacilli bacterium]|nr:hypothetical protein [Bacilli bacterium]
EWWEKKKAKEEAQKIAAEKEQELQEIYQKQLKAMEKAKKASGETVSTSMSDVNPAADTKELFREALTKDGKEKPEDK